MQWIKASERLPASSNLVHLTYGKKLGEFKTTGYYEDDTWHYQNGETVTIAGNLHWLDESPPASIEQEAARMYPLEDTAEKGEAGYMFTRNEITDIERQAHIRCAGMYTDTIDKLKAEVEHWKDEFETAVLELRALKHKHNL